MQKEATESAYGNFQVISDSIEDLNSLITSISAAVSEQSATTQEIMDSIGGVAESSNETGDVMTELINDTDSLLRSIRSISEKYAKFTLTSKGFYFAIAKIAHVNLMKSVFDCYSNGNCSISLPTHHTCSFGEFYYGVGMKLFGSDSDYKAMEEPHKLVHKLSHELVDSVKAGDRNEAARVFDSLESAVSNLVRMLDNMIDKYK